MRAFQERRCRRASARSFQRTPKPKHSRGLLVGRRTKPRAATRHSRRIQLRPRDAHKGLGDVAAGAATGTKVVCPALYPAAAPL